MSKYFRKTKIVCTLGPASNDKNVLAGLIKNGLDIARLNFSHGTHHEHARRFKMLREAALKLNKKISVIQDLEGHRIRLGILKDNKPLNLKRGDKVYIISGKKTNKESTLPVNYPNFGKYLKTGFTIYADDGKIALKIRKIDKKGVLAKALTGGSLKSHKGINVPEAKFKFPHISKKDKKDIDFGLKLGVDIIAQSFVRSDTDIKVLKKYLKNKKADLPVIAKIEDAEGIKNIDKIIEAADAVIVARGDLGVVLSLEKVPHIQKQIIKRCNQLGKPVITATQMLESMTQNKRPTRAEVTDVANAVLDGTDMVMLSGETAMGRFPKEAVSYMNRITVATEKSLNYKNLLAEREIKPEDNIAEAVGLGIRNLAQLVDIKAIVVYTRSGQSARLIAKFKPADMIIAVSDSKKTLNNLQLYWGLRPVHISSSCKTPKKILNFLVNKKIISKGELIVFTKGISSNSNKYGSIEIFKA